MCAPHVSPAPAGILRTLLCYPLDFCRTRLTADMTPAGQARPFSGIVSCLRHAAAHEGVLSWYKGMGMSLPGVVVYTSISFSAYDGLKVCVCVCVWGGGGLVLVACAAGVPCTAGAGMQSDAAAMCGMPARQAPR
jgi:hypothetical protein